MTSTKQPAVAGTEEPQKAPTPDQPAPKVNEKAEPATPQKEPAADEPPPAKANEKPEPAKNGDKASKKEKVDKYAGLKKVGKVLLYALPVVLVLFFVWYKFIKAPTVFVAQVRQQDYTGELQGTGTVNVAVLAAVGAKIPGRIERMLVDEGDVVHAGQVIATLEDTDIRHVLQGAQGRLQAARMVEQEARAMEQSAGATERSARAHEKERRATEYQAGRAWEREKHLVATGAVSQEEADQYQERQRSAESAVESAQAEIEAAHAQIAAAGAKALAAHSEISAMEAEVHLQEFNLSQTQIFTYVSGIIADRPKRSGDAIISGEAVVRVADPKLILVEAYLDQRSAGDVKVGQTATVTLRGRAKEIAGSVYRVRPQADAAAEQMTVEVAFPLPPAELQIGQWADVYIAISQMKNALVVPKTAVMQMGADRVVLVAGADHRVRQVKVESSTSSPRSQVMAVMGDLANGDWVLTEPMGIKPGQRVNPDRNAAPSKAPAMGNSPVMKM